MAVVRRRPRRLKCMRRVTMYPPVGERRGMLKQLGIREEDF